MHQFWRGLHCVVFVFVMEVGLNSLFNRHDFCCVIGVLCLGLNHFLLRQYFLYYYVQWIILVSAYSLYMWVLDLCAGGISQPVIAFPCRRLTLPELAAPTKK